MDLRFWAWYEIGRFGLVAILAGAGWLSRQKWIPHKHTGYVSMSGQAIGCYTCGKKPETARCQRCERPHAADRECPWCPRPGYARCYSGCGDTVPENTMTNGYCASCWNEWAGKINIT